MGTGDRTWCCMFSRLRTSQITQRLGFRFIFNEILFATILQQPQMVADKRTARWKISSCLGCFLSSSVWGAPAMAGGATGTVPVGRGPQRSGVSAGEWREDKGDKGREGERGPGGDPDPMSARGQGGGWPWAAPHLSPGPVPRLSAMGQRPRGYFCHEGTPAPCLAATHPGWPCRTLPCPTGRGCWPAGHQSRSLGQGWPCSPPAPSVTAWQMDMAARPSAWPCPRSVLARWVLDPFGAGLMHWALLARHGRWHCQRQRALRHATLLRDSWMRCSCPTSPRPRTGASAAPLARASPVPRRRGHPHPPRPWTPCLHWGWLCFGAVTGTG